MAKQQDPIVFVTPGASPVGGNIFFIDFLKWYKKNSAEGFLTIYGHGGDLETELAGLGSTFRFDPDPQYRNIFDRAFKVVARILGLRRFYFRNYWLRRKLGGSEIGLIYSNAVTNYRILSAIGPTKAPVISHCHEMESIIHRMGIDDFRATCAMTTHFVAASNAVKNNLITNHGIDPDRVTVIHEFIEIPEFKPAELAEKRQRVLSEFDIPENALIVGGSGTLYWRKAPELFIQVADILRRKHPDLPIWFIWVGGGKKGDFRFFELNFDLEKLGLTERVRFLEHKTDPSAYFAALDIFLMISREDAYPLVCLETAAMATPIICFENGGGMPEFVEEDCGFVVPYLDVEAVAEKVVKLYQDPALRERMGASAAIKVRQRHHIEAIAPDVAELIERFRV